MAMQRLVIIDYGSGNLHSAAKALERAARESEVATSVEISARPADVLAADRVVLPGVGAFADCKRGLDAVAGMREALETTVRGKRRPFLGICVGMQLMAQRGLEFHVTPGLGWIKGDVVAIAPQDPALKIPHMGWNTLHLVNSHPLMAGIKTGPQGLHAYFVHSFHLATPDPSLLIAQTEYGGPVTAMVGADNIAGTQFHPEKSLALGLRLLANFLKWQP
jgi:imidazole glycerol-phosphate synthase subunit HisH